MSLSESEILDSDIFAVDTKPDTFTDEKLACCELIDTDEIFDKFVPTPTFPRNKLPFDIYKLLEALAAVSRSTRVDSDTYAVDISPVTFIDEKTPCCELIDTDDTFDEFPPPTATVPRYKLPFDMYKLLEAFAAVSRSNIDDSDIYAVEIKPDTLTDEKFACCELTRPVITAGALTVDPNDAGPKVDIWDAVRLDVNKTFVIVEPLITAFIPTASVEVVDMAPPV